MTEPAVRSTRTIKVDTLARVEGEGALFIRIQNGEVRDVKLRIFEPPRFFEAFLRDRHFREVPDITARICGICPVAYQLGSAHALEQACGVTVEGPLRDLRHLLYCGEWIESHALHLFLLHAPDFLGYQDAIRMAQDHPDVVKRGLEIKKTGNRLMQVIGGREIHPINVRVGGFYRLPPASELRALIEPLERSLEAAVDTLRLTACFAYPDFERDYEFVALSHPDEYAILSGRLVSNRGLDINLEDFPSHFDEEHLAHSTSLHAYHRGHGAYLVGPLARYNLSFEKLSPLARDAALAVGLTPTCLNPFRSIMIRCVEIVHACEVAIGLIRAWREPSAPAVEVNPRSASGVGCTEAPRGICWHRYTIDDSGLIKDARIVPPTSQNQASIEEDIRRFVAAHLDLPDEELRWKCEQAVRNYDPCISCSCHFLKLHVERT